MTPYERLSLAIHLESAAIAPRTSELIEAAKEVLRENELLRGLIAEGPDRDFLIDRRLETERLGALNQQLTPGSE